MQTKKRVPAEQINKIYEPGVISDRTEELLKKAEEANIRQHEQTLAEKRHKEDLKQKRILATKEDKFIHAINLIIERAKYQSSPSFSIDFYDFNFEDTMDNLRVLLGFLDSLVASGCLKSYSKTSYTGGVRIYFNGVDIAKLEDFRDKRPLPQPEPTLTKIVGIPQIDIKGFEEKVVLQKPKNKRIALKRFPPDTKWQDITIRFLNEHEVIVEVKNETHQTNYEVMGFGDAKTKLPNKQWGFLRLLSFKGGELSWENNKDLPVKQINSIKKQKQLLAEELKAYFQIDEDPFYSYKQEGAYRIKMTLIPEAGQQGNRSENKSDEIEEYLKETSPEVFDE